MQLQQIVVAFEGPDSGTEDLTWGQLAHWGSQLMSGVTEPAGGMMALPAGTTVQGTANLLAFIMSRHQAMRTRIRLDADGTPKQVVLASGEIALEVADTEAGEDPEKTADEIRVRYETSHWDLSTEWPVRMAVIRHNGVASHFVAIYANIVVDGYGIDALRGDLPNLDAETGRHLGPVPSAVPPLEQARLQRLPAARRQHDASLRHWERHLRTIPPRRFTAPTVPAQPRYWEASYSSPATHLALGMIAERTKINTGAILLGAYAVALGRISQQSPSVVRTLVSNRFRPGFAESVSNLAQSGLCVIDVADCTFDQAVERAFKSQLSAGTHAYYDPRELWRLIDRVNAERGVEVDLMCYFNDRRRAMAQAPAAVGYGPKDIVAALPRSQLRWGKQWDTPDVTCYLHVNAVPQTIDYTMFVDTHQASIDDLEACLRGMEEVIVAAALDPATPTGVPSVPA